MLLAVVGCARAKRRDLGAQFDWPALVLLLLVDLVLELIDLHLPPLFEEPHVPHELKRRPPHGLGLRADGVMPS